MANKGTCAKCGAINMFPAGVKEFDGLECGVAGCTGALTRFHAIHMRQTSIYTHARRPGGLPHGLPETQVADVPDQLPMFRTEADNETSH